MRVQTLIFPFLLSVALGFLDVLVPIHALATCTNPCGCGRCAMKYFTNPPCQCPGEGGCPTCLTEDSDPMQFNVFPDKSVVDTSVVPEWLTPTLAKVDATEGVMDLMSGGKCFRQKVAFSLLGNARDDLKYVAVQF